MIGGGIAGLRAALGLAEIGLAVFLVEKEAQLGGWVGGFGEMYPHGKNGRELVARLDGEGARAPGHHRVHERRGGRQVAAASATTRCTVRDRTASQRETITGARSARSSWPPASTPTSRRPASSATASRAWSRCPSSSRLVDAADGPLEYDGRPVKTIAYIYCVGSRQGETSRRQRVLLPLLLHGGRARLARGGRARATPACASTTCTATSAPTASTSCSTTSRGRRARSTCASPTTNRRRCERARRPAASGHHPRPAHRRRGDRPSRPTWWCWSPAWCRGTTSELIKRLKLPVGNDGFFNEIHPKLRPVETVVDGVFICGACQSPKNSAESVASRPGGGHAERAPSSSAASPSSTRWWPSSTPTPAPGAASAWRPAPTRRRRAGRGGRQGGGHHRQDRLQGLRRLRAGLPEDAIDLQGYTDAQIRAMIDGLLEVSCS